VTQCSTEVILLSMSRDDILFELLTTEQQAGQIARRGPRPPGGGDGTVVAGPGPHLGVVRDADGGSGPVGPIPRDILFPRLPRRTRWDDDPAIHGDPCA